MQRGPIKIGSAVVDQEFLRLAPSPDPGRSPLFGELAGSLHGFLRRQRTPSQLSRWLAHSQASIGNSASVEPPARASGRGRSTLTGKVVRLLVVSLLSLSGRLRVSGGGESPPTTTGHTAWPLRFFGSEAALSGGPSRLPAPSGFQHRVVAARGRSRAGPGRVDASSEVPITPTWPRSQACCCLRFAPPPSGGGAFLGLGRSCRPVWSWSSSSGPVSSEARPSPLSRTRACTSPC